MQRDMQAIQRTLLEAMQNTVAIEARSKTALATQAVARSPSPLRGRASPGNSITVSTTTFPPSTTTFQPAVECTVGKTVVLPQTTTLRQAYPSSPQTAMADDLLLDVIQAPPNFINAPKT